MIDLVKDFRQSKDWSSYLSTLGWDTLTTKNGVLFYYKSAGLLKVGKVQRPFSLTADALAEIEAFCTEKKIQVLKIEPSDELQADLLTTSGYIQSTFNLAPPATSQIDLTLDEGVLWENLSKSAKYSVNRARREHARVEIFQCPSDDVLKDFYVLAQETSRAKNFHIQSFHDHLNKVAIFQDRSFLTLVYDKDNNLCGGKFYLGYGNRVWYLHGGTSHIGRKNKTGYVLVWESFLYFKRLGYHTLDFEGIMDSRFKSTQHWGGLTDFKEKFGGRDIRYPYPQMKVFNKLLGFISKAFGVSL